MSNSVEDLVKEIQVANRNYYLLGVSLMSDAEYDEKINQLRQLDPYNPILNKVGDDSEAENKVKLPILMGSLNKVRPSENDLAKLYYAQDLVRMPKLDGLSLLASYKDGKFYKLYTRGSGFEGQDITYRGNLMPFPKELTEPFNKGMVYIIGEAVISRANFLQVKGDYKHPRNTVGGTLRPILTDAEYENVDESIKYNCSLIDFVTYGVYAQENIFKYFTDCLITLQKQGFKTANYEVINCNDITPEYLSNWIKTYEKDYDYLTDGIVLKINDIKLFDSLGKEANGLNPKGARAVKANLEEQFSQIGIIDEIIWEISKRGNFVPVIHLKNTLEFDGVAVDRISAVNADYVEQNRWAPGAKVKVIRSGGVIPRVIATDSRKAEPIKIPDICPYCETKLERNSAHVYCPNVNCAGRNREGVITFFVDLNLDSVSYETVAGLYDKGFNSITKLLNIRYRDLIELEGYQAKKAMSVEEALNNCLHGVTLTKLLYVSQCFQNEKTSLGETKLQWIVDHYGEDNLISKLDNKEDLDFTGLDSINGIGDAAKDLFKSGWAIFRGIYNELKSYIEFAKPEFDSHKLDGKSFAFTGFRDLKMEELIIRNGGSVKGVSKKTYVLFAANTDSTKAKAAEKNNIPIIPAHQCKEYLVDLLKSISEE